MLVDLLPRLVADELLPDCAFDSYFHGITPIVDYFYFDVCHTYNSRPSQSRSLFYILNFCLLWLFCHLSEVTSVWHKLDGLGKSIYDNIQAEP